MASVVQLLGRGGQRFAEKTLKWNRGTTRKGQQEIDSGIDQIDRFHDRGRHHTTLQFPDILADFHEIVRPKSQTDPTFQSTRIYTRMSAREILRRVTKMPKYVGAKLPCERTVRNLLGMAKIYQKRIAKTKPKKKIPETNAIFDEVHRINAEADANPRKLRISLDTKAVVTIGNFSRGGKSYQKLCAYDHDFDPVAKVVPFGIFLPETNENFFYFTESKVTADFMVDRLKQLWPTLIKRCPEMEALVINADNGSESSGRRTQWLNRLVAFADEKGIRIELAYYPPYHSKYNPVERCWGVLENYWRGELIQTIEKALGLARSMTYNGVHPVVKLIKKTYSNGVTLGKEAMIGVEARLERKSGLEKWFISISPAGRLG